MSLLIEGTLIKSLDFYIYIYIFFFIKQLWWIFNDKSLFTIKLHLTVSHLIRSVWYLAYCRNGFSSLKRQEETTKGQRRSKEGEWLVWDGTTGQSWQRDYNTFWLNFDFGYISFYYLHFVFITYFVFVCLFLPTLFIFYIAFSFQSAVTGTANVTVNGKKPSGKWLVLFFINRS